MSTSEHDHTPAPALEMSGGPWGGGNGPDNGERPTGDDGKRRGSPWLPGGGTGGGGNGGGPAGGGGGRGLDDLLRKGPFGPEMPRLPGGFSWWQWAIGLFLFLWLSLTSVHSIDSQEEGVITRLGSYSRTVGPGIALTMPMPFETMVRVPARRIQSEDIPEGSGPNLILTGDASIVSLAYTVRWTVKQPELYVFQLDNPQATIRSAAESAMRSTIANFTLAQALGSGQSAISEQAKDQLQAILDYYRSGIRIESVSIRSSAPPREVEEAFNEVNAARQTRESRLNEARGYAARLLRVAEGDAAEFDLIYEQYRLAPQVTRRRIYYETMEQVLSPAEKTVIDSNGVVPYLPLPEVRRTAPARETEARP